MTTTGLNSITVILPIPPLDLSKNGRVKTANGREKW